jgi:hypothetical protein
MSVKNAGSTDHPTINRRRVRTAASRPTVSIQISIEMHDALFGLADSCGASVSGFIRGCLSAFLDQPQLQTHVMKDLEEALQTIGYKNRKLLSYTQLIVLTPVIIELLDVIARQYGVTRSSLIRRVLYTYWLFEPMRPWFTTAINREAMQLV